MAVTVNFAAKRINKTGTGLRDVDRRMPACLSCIIIRGLDIFCYLFSL